MSKVSVGAAGVVLAALCIMAHEAQGLEASSDAVADLGCKAVRSAMDRAPPVNADVAAILKAVRQIYTELDSGRAAGGKSRIFARMSGDGQTNTLAMATSRCERYPGETLRQSAVTVYEGIEALGRTLGTND